MGRLPQGRLEKLPEPGNSGIALNKAPRTGAT